MPKPFITRRRFLCSAAVTTAGLFAAPALLRANSLNEKLNLGLIGVGNKGAENLKNLSDQNVVALCDVDENFLDAAADRKSTRLNSSHGYISYAVLCLNNKHRCPRCAYRSST